MAEILLRTDLHTIVSTLIQHGFSQRSSQPTNSTTCNGKSIESGDTNTMSVVPPFYWAQSHRSHRYALTVTGQYALRDHFLILTKLKEYGIAEYYYQVISSSSGGSRFS